MLAAYVTEPDFSEPLQALRVGERPEASVPPGWLRVRMEAASLNRHDLWTLRGVTQHPPLPLPMILGCDGAGRLEDGSPVILYPGIGDPGWREEETLDPQFSVFSEKCFGTMADYVAAPLRSIIPRPKELSSVTAAALGTTWLTAYKMLFVRSGLRPGQRMLVQGASGGVSTALIQLGEAAGLEVWVTGRSSEKRAMALRLGAHLAFESNMDLPSQVDGVFETVGKATWAHSLKSVRRGGVVVLAGRTSGNDPPAELREIFVRQIRVLGSVLGSLSDMHDLIRFVIHADIQPEIGRILPLEQAALGFRAMWNDEALGKTIFTRAA